MNKVRGVIYKKDDEYFTPEYAIYPILKYIPKRSKIWCPFDTFESNIVKVLVYAGHEVKHSHISEGLDFFYQNFDCDIIISNPPYSLRTELFERLFHLGKRFCMLMGNLGLFDCKKRFDLFKENSFEIMYMDKRINYFKDKNDKKNGCPFSSSWITKGILPAQIVFERIERLRME